MQDFEKLGLFYLGKIVDPSTREDRDDLLLYESKNLTTHAVCVGMTGSGKTGLGITLLEEASIDKIPSIAIDPKGDLGNLLLAFPHLTPEEFLPWVDSAEAERKGMPLKVYSEAVATMWKDGLAKWGEGAERVQKFKNSVETVIYTPASRAGVPLSILSSFAAPTREQVLDSDALRDRVLTLSSSLLGLVGITADPIKSREHILISTIISLAWQKGLNLDIAALIQQIQKPPFNKIGALDIDTFLPPKERMALSISLNNLLASPGFQAWMEGEPLDINTLLYNKEGKPKLSILSIAHLSDSERMFFVTLFLNEYLSWMRRQPGTSSLRTLLYMDEIFGYFPPTAMPPSKLPMLTLLKQARAFGAGIVLATQNPVDLDYKGLSNCGTWFIGKLQTERDKARVLEGLSLASNGEIDSDSLDKMIASTGNRIFIMRSIHEKDPILFQTRWSLSYLRGPLTLMQIETLTDKSKVASYASETSFLSNINQAASDTKPLVAPGITEFFVHNANKIQGVHYKPFVLGVAKLHFIEAKSKIDTWKELCLVSSVNEDGKSVRWEEGKIISGLKTQLEKTSIPGSTFEQLPAGLMQQKNYALFEKALAACLYQSQSMTLFQAIEYNQTSKEGESEGDFRARMALMQREKRDEVVKKLREKYEAKIKMLVDKVRRAQEKLAQMQQKSGLQKTDTLISVGTTILGALFGRGMTKGTISNAGTSIRRAGRIGKDSRDVTVAEEDYKLAQRQLDELQAQLNNEINAITNIDPQGIKVETIQISPRKSDISIEQVAVLWIG